MEKRIKKLLKQNNGIITTKQIEEIGISRVHIKQFIENGIIERVKKGIYISCDMLEDEFYIFQLKNKSAIFSYNTAMYLFRASERTPDKIRVYNMEKTICDILKDRNTGIDKEQTNKFIRNMIVHNQVDLKKIWEYSKKLKCEKQLEKVMEWII